MRIDVSYLRSITTITCQFAKQSWRLVGTHEVLLISPAASSFAERALFTLDGENFVMHRGWPHGFFCMGRDNPLKVLDNNSHFTQISNSQNWQLTMSVRGTSSSAYTNQLNVFHLFSLAMTEPWLERRELNLKEQGADYGNRCQVKKQKVASRTETTLSNLCIHHRFCQSSSALKQC